jgi:hypothetical protein
MHLRASLTVTHSTIIQRQRQYAEEGLGQPASAAERFEPKVQFFGEAVLNR